MLLTITLLRDNSCGSAAELVVSELLPKEVSDWFKEARWPERLAVSAPEPRRRRVHQACLVTYTRLAVLRQQQWTVEIDDFRSLRKDHGRRHGERGGKHAAHHDAKSQFFRRAAQGEGSCQPAGFIELDV